MLDFVFRFLGLEENERRRQVSFLLSLLLIADMTSWLYSRVVGEYSLVRFTDVDGIIRFVLKGDLVLVLILFFLLWAVLNSFLDFLFSILHPPVANKLWIFCSESLVRAMYKEGRSGSFLKKFFENLGFVKLVNSKLSPGVLLVQGAKRLEKAFREDRGGLQVKKPMTAALVVQFVLTYWLVVRGHIQIPILVEIALHIFGGIIILMDIFLNGVLHMALVHIQEIRSLILGEEEEPNTTLETKGEAKA